MHDSDHGCDRDHWQGHGPRPETLAAACAGKQATIAAGASAWLATEIVNIYYRGYYGTGKAGHVTDIARTLLGREPRSFRQFARDHAALLAP